MNGIPAAAGFWTDQFVPFVDCLLWTGHLTPDGYPGGVRFGTQKMGAHRASYTAAHGDIPQGMDVDHICFTTACIRDRVQRYKAKQIAS